LTSYSPRFYYKTEAVLLDSNSVIPEFLIGGMVVRHTISMLVDNEPGVLARVAGFLSARGCNIEALCVARTLDPMMSRITLVTSGEDWIIDEIIKRFSNMMSVIKIQDLTELTSVEREMVLVRVEVTQETKAEVLRMADIFRAKVIDVGPQSYALELTGDKDKVTTFIELIKPMGIIEIARTGILAMAREVQDNKEMRKKIFG
jgi:acetolactate synthase I/III small subunit